MLSVIDPFVFFRLIAFFVVQDERRLDAQAVLLLHICNKTSKIFIYSLAVPHRHAQHQLTDMICRDKNRANIIIWSIANETPHSPERDKFLGSLAQYARSLDNTRLISNDAI